MKSTSWESVGKWYDKSVGKEGHYYHQHVIIPKLSELIEFKKKSKVLDLACGQGILSRHLPKHIGYVGVDLSNSLIKAAKKYDRLKNHAYITSDITKKLPIDDCDFTHCFILLALQNIEHPKKVFQNAHRHLNENGKFIFVINHPCFRIPRQTSWGIDSPKKQQYRRIDRYMTAMTIPIKAHPSKGKASAETFSFHHPISAYSKWLKEAGFSIEVIEEWCSDKVSTGKAAKMENRARQEIPLFLTVVASKAQVPH